MKKLNENGFLLVETLIVTVFVVSIFIFIYSNTVPLVGKYEQRFKYDDLDSVYAADLVRELIMSSTNFEAVRNLSPGTQIKSVTCDQIGNGNNAYKTYCEALIKELSVDKIYITHYSLTALKTAIDKKEIAEIQDYNNRGLKSYIDYMPTFTFNADLVNQNRIIIIRKVEEYGYVYTRYANIELMH